jgi:undecaprenyl-diphosphatase
MESTLHAALLGLIQALTEFLPVSSSGHLKLGHAWLGFEATNDLAFVLVLHAGTLVAVFIVYWKRILGLLRGVAAGVADLPSGVRNALERHEGLRYLLLIVVATIPTGIIGLLLEDWVETGITSPRLVGGLLMINGLMLFQSRRFTGDDQQDRGPLSVGGIGVREALIIGVMQGVAVLPGISRAGTTIVTALAVGAWRLRAAEFSFFLSIPAILGAIVLKLDPAELAASQGGLVDYGVGAAVAAVGGVFALKVLLGLLRDARLHSFAYYCWLIGLVAIIIG